MVLNTEIITSLPAEKWRWQEEVDYLAGSTKEEPSHCLLDISSVVGC